MIAFGMKATLVCYQDEYFNYKRVVEDSANDGNEDENGLAIRTYEAAFCADMGATYELTVTMDRLSSGNTYHTDKQSTGSANSKSRSTNWWGVTNSNSLQMYGTHHNTTIHPPWKPWMKSYQMRSGGNGRRRSIYHKKSQTVKYVNRESCHQTAVFKAIPAGVFTCIGRLTSMTDENKNAPITSLYATHADTLKKASILSKKFQQFKIYMNRNSEEKKYRKKKEEEKNRRHDKCTIYFVIGHAQFWAIFHLARIVNRLTKKFKLTYLRFSMAYMRFTNLQEKFRGDLVAK
eukprot:882229-Ditylum_brightwellii.AAC.1